MFQLIVLLLYFTEFKSPVNFVMEQFVSTIHLLLKELFETKWYFKGLILIF